MMPWLIAALSGFGGGIIGSLVIEAYQQRRASDRVHDYDLPGDHRSGS